MVKFLTRVGNSEALVIDKAILSLLHISKTTPLEITTDGKNLVISPISLGAHRKEARFSHRKRPTPEN
jgi:antitoxin component of MazEF toxin-antitoxin module